MNTFYKEMFLQCRFGNFFQHISLLETIVICDVLGTVNTAKFC